MDEQALEEIQNRAADIKMSAIEAKGLGDTSYAVGHLILLCNDIERLLAERMIAAGVA